MKTVVIINGYPGSGKDTFVEMCQKHYPYTTNVHTSSPAKTAAKVLGWKGEKTPQARAFLASLVYSSYEMFDGPTNHVLNILKGTGAPVTFVHSREPNRIHHLKETLQAHGYRVLTLFIIRDVKEEFSNEADADVWRYNYDNYIYNNGTLGELHDNAGRFMDKLYQGGDSNVLI